MLTSLHPQSFKFISAVALLAASSAAFAQSPAGNITHNGAITSPIGNLCLDAARAAQDDGINVQTGSCQNGTASWEVIDLGRGEYALMNRLTRRALDLSGGANNDGANVQQFTWNGSTAQRWRLSQQANRSYQIINVGSGKCLDANRINAGAAAGSNVAQWTCHGGDNQQWFLGNVPANIPSPVISVGGAAPVVGNTVGNAGGGWTKPAVDNVNDQNNFNSSIRVVNNKLQGRVLYSGLIVSRASAKCVDLENLGNNDNTSIRQRTCLGGNGQLWDFLDADNGEMVIMARAATNKVMDVSGASSRDGADVAQYTWSGGANQRWRLEQTERGFFKLVSVGSNKCLDLSQDGGGKQDGANIVQWSCHGRDNQQWRIEVRGAGQGWNNYRPQSNVFVPNANYSDLPPSNIVGRWEGFNPAYQSVVRLTINTDGTAIAELDNNLRVNGYFRQGRLYLGAERYDIQRERRGFRTVQIGQTSNVVSYTRAR